jgi:hypothetical protein
LTVTTKVSGGNGKPSDFTINVAGKSPSPKLFSGSSSGTSVILNAGKYKVAGSGPSGYAAKYSSGCSGTASGGTPAKCTISASYSPSPPPSPSPTPSGSNSASTTKSLSSKSPLATGAHATNQTHLLSFMYLSRIWMMDILPGDPTLVDNMLPGGRQMTGCLVEMKRDGSNTILVMIIGILLARLDFILIIQVAALILVKSRSQELLRFPRHGEENVLYRRATMHLRHIWFATRSNSKVAQSRRSHMLYLFLN